MGLFKLSQQGERGGGKWAVLGCKLRPYFELKYTIPQPSTYLGMKLCQCVSLFIRRGENFPEENGRSLKKIFFDDTDFHFSISITNFYLLGSFYLWKLNCITFWKIAHPNIQWRLRKKIQVAKVWVLNFDKNPTLFQILLRNKTMMNTKTDTQGSSSPLSNMNELLDEWLQVQSNNMKLESDDVFYNVSKDCLYNITVCTWCGCCSTTVIL